MSILRTNYVEMETLRAQEPAEPRARQSAPHANGLPPVILIGGEANALSVARELGRQGIAVFATGKQRTCVRYSRYCQWIDPPAGDDAETSLLALFCGRGSERLHGALLLACSDDGLTLLARHRDQLSQRYLLDLAHPPAQIDMLDKLRTYQIAQAADVATPRFWAVTSRAQVESLKDELVYPLLVKPRMSHLFEEHFGRKYMLAHGFEQLLELFDVVAEAQMRVLLTELIPGGDDQLSSYFTYIDERGEALCHYTKRVIRRYPNGMGAACYHITGDVPEIVEPSLRLIRQSGVRGLANVEFKFDHRDGRHKLIECNARFTASNALVAASGLRLATFVYHRATGRSARLVTTSGRVMRQWDPVRDFAAFLHLRRSGQITLGQWVRSIMHRMTFPYFSWSDPAPTLARLFKGSLGRLPRMGKRL